jgi:hypothetical protein
MTRYTFVVDHTSTRSDHLVIEADDEDEAYDRALAHTRYGIKDGVVEYAEGDACTHTDDIPDITLIETEHDEPESASMETGWDYQRGPSYE